MADVQLENGYTRIANELLEAVLKTPFIATHLKIILACWRYTYGFGRKEAELSLSFLANATGMSKRYVSDALSELISSNVLKVIKESTYSSSRIIAFNKNYEEWRYRACRTPLQQVNPTSTVEAEQDTTVEPQFNTTVELQFHQERKHKENINKGDYEKLFEDLWQIYPKKKGKGAVSKTQKQKLFRIGYDRLAKAINKYKKEREGQDSQFTMYGSTFFNSGYLDYLEDEDADKPKPEPKPMKFISYDERIAELQEAEKIKAEAHTEKMKLMYKEFTL